MRKLEGILKRLFNSKSSKKQVVQKLIDVCKLQGEDINALVSQSVNLKDEISFDALIDDASVSSENRIGMEDQRHKHKISNTNSNFYKFRSNQDRILNVANDRPKSSKGGVRQSITSNA